MIDAQTLTHEKTIKYSAAQYPVFRGHPHSVIDEAGNTYLIAQGQYGLDGKPFDPASRPQILKINTNSEFVEDYNFFPIDILGNQNAVPLFTSMVYGGNNKVYGIGTATADDPQLLQYLALMAQGQLDENGMAQLIQLVLYGESMNVLEIDLNAKTSKVVDGIPFTAGFGYPMMYYHKGKVYAQVANATENKNAFYEIDPSTGTAKMAFNITAGGFAYHILDLSEDL